MTDVNALVHLFQKRLDAQVYTALDENKYDQAYFKHAGITSVEIRTYQLHGIRWLIERYEAGHGASEESDALLPSVSVHASSSSQR